jgi:hypothetical protein
MQLASFPAALGSAARRRVLGFGISAESFFFA